ncbi:hypothetical protein FHU28_004252 [Micromonospora echinospora]|uniref:Tetracyclin repressor-like C-terminal group 31 domain-containing protein n=1 Tax=Micromonospora echinospora TaxID=1877 RepID=A0ABR6MGB2_MICEC|nr:hypothetical protein [Micromonospora echinospora]
MDAEGRGAQGGLQVGALDPGQPPAVAGAKSTGRVGPAVAPHGVTEAERVEPAQRVGHQRQAGAEFARAVRALQHRDAPSAPTQRDGRLLEATHRPELRAILHHGSVLRVQARELLSRAGAAEPLRQGDQFVAFVDGLLFDRLVGAGALSAPPPGTPAGRDDLRAAVRTLLRAFTGA